MTALVDARWTQRPIADADVYGGCVAKTKPVRVRGVVPRMDRADVDPVDVEAVLNLFRLADVMLQALARIVRPVGSDPDRRRRLAGAGHRRGRR